jgi:acetyl-CoA/propionyl-CoA carboxylase biotin carboxyl carrier protein
LPRARREAAAAFGDDRLIIERYLPRARHIEVQVLADAFGDVRAVGDRECTMQRRHQKVIEEAPAPNLPDAVREAIHSAAVAVVREVGYLNAGTVEFVVSAEDSTEFYFLEVNTRLQVEHPVTEEVLGIDLVKCQLRIAEGASLASLEIPEQTHGHAFEARVYAEDADRGFLPTGGRIAHWRVPALSGLRVDAAVASGDVVGSAYDPMIAKVIVHAETREQARRALVNALKDTAVLGVVTNTAFLVDLLETDEVASAQMDTRFIERFVESRTLATPTTLQIALWAATRASAAEVASLLRPLSPAWKSADSWRLAGAGKQLWRGSIEGTAVTAHTHHTSEGLMVSVVHDEVQDQHLVAQTHESDGHFTATVDGESVSWDAARASDSDGEHWWLSMRGYSWVIDSRQQLRAARVAGSQDPQVRSPMPGTVVRIDVAVGDSVEAGQQLIGVEAMKMEHALVAPHAGTVTEVTCQVGAHVKLREVLITVEPST